MSKYNHALISLINEQATTYPDRLAILAPGRSALSYQALLQHIKHVVGILNGLGLHRQDRVAIVLPNGPEMALTFLAVAAGMTSAPLNPLYQAAEYDFYLGDLDAKAVIVQTEVESTVREVARQRNIPVIELSPLRDAAAGIFTFPDISPTTTTIPEYAAAEDTALVLHTSGTTSRPKIVPLSHTNLLASADNIRHALNLSPEDRCLNIMPLFHIHGLIAAVLSTLSAGASVVCTEGFYAPIFFEHLKTFAPTWYTAVPTMHQSILARSSIHGDVHAETVQQSRLRFIRSSSAPLPPSVMSRLETIFNAPVIEAYGMTEAAHQIASNPLPPAVRKPGSVGIAAGPEVAIMDVAGLLLNAGEIGEIVIRGDDVTSGYQNNETANTSAFTNGWFRTGDQGYLDVDGYVFITGRLKEIINRGGQKISPREVDEILLQHPAVAQAVTFAVPHPTLGEDVAAAIVLKSESERLAIPDLPEATEAGLRAYAAQFLTYNKIPHQIIFLEDLPKGPTGKLQRVNLATQLGLTGNQASEKVLSDSTTTQSTVFVAARTPLEETVVEIWKEVLRIPSVSVHDDFASLGGDSMLATLVVTRLRKATGTNVRLVDFLETPTVAAMAVVITQMQLNRLSEDEINQILSSLEDQPEV